MERGPRKGNSRTVRLVLIAGIVAAVIGMVASSSPGALSGWDAARAAPLSIILVLAVMRLAVSTQPLGRMARQLSFFLIAGTVLVVGYSYRDDLGVMFGRTLGSVVPGHGTQIAPGMMRFQADDGGQFVIDATVNNSADAARNVSDEVRHMQSGNLRSYAGWIAVGSAVVIAYMIWKWTGAR